jgi:type I restriction enzyme, S subunit
MSSSATRKAGWTPVALGDVVQLVRERSSDPQGDGFDRYVGLEHIDPGDLRIRRWGYVSEGTTFTNVFRAGQVLFGKRRAYQRKVSVADFDGVCSGDIYVFEPKGDRLLPELLPFICQTDRFFEHAIETSAGSLSPRTNWDNLAAFQFPLPPVDEQRRIAAAGDAMLRASTALRQVTIEADRARRALFGALYTEGTSGERRKPTPIGPLPESWSVERLEARYEVQLGKRISERELTGDLVIPYMRNANVQWNHLDLDDVATVRVTESERAKYALRTGDILACEGRHVGKAAMWRDEVPGAIYQMALHRLRPLTDFDVPVYMLHCLQYYSWSGRFIAETGETTIPHLSAERFRAMLFPFPTRVEQQRIAERIEQFDACNDALYRRSADMTAMMRRLSGTLE